MLYAGFAFADSMVPENCRCERNRLFIENVKRLLAQNEWRNACNIAHRATLEALKDRFDIDLLSSLPSTPPNVSLVEGDMFLVLSVRGLPRLTENRHYTAEEIAQATFKFGVWEVLDE